MTGLQTVGVIILANGLIIGIALLINRTIDWKVFLAIEAAFVLSALVASNLDRISGFGVKASGAALDVKIARVESRAEEVEAIASEIRSAKDAIQLLVHNANLTNEKLSGAEIRVNDLLRDAEAKRQQIEALEQQTETAATAVKQVEANVVQMRNDVRQTLRSIFGSLAYSLGVRNVFPFPAFVAQEIDRHLNLLATFAYPDPAERGQQVAKVMADIRKAQSNPEK